jgi:Ca-activated chloride channel family protein
MVLSPLTLDYDALQALLFQARQINLSDGTAIGVAVAEALNLLRDSRARSRVAILLTDGENNNQTVEPLAAARVAQTLGIRLYTIGVVAEERPQAEGKPNVDEEALRKMAELTEASYYRADSPEALERVYEDIGRLEKSRVGRKQFAAFDELAVYFLGMALLLLALELGLTATVWRRTA